MQLDLRTSELSDLLSPQFTAVVALTLALKDAEEPDFRSELEATIALLKGRIARLLPHARHGTPGFSKIFERVIDLEDIDLIEALPDVPHAFKTASRWKLRDLWERHGLAFLLLLVRKGMEFSSDDALTVLLHLPNLPDSPEFLSFLIKFQARKRFIPEAYWRNESMTDQPFIRLPIPIHAAFIRAHIDLHPDATARYAAQCIERVELHPLAILLAAGVKPQTKFLDGTALQIANSLSSAHVRMHLIDQCGDLEQVLSHPRVAVAQLEHDLPKYCPM